MTQCAEIRPWPKVFSCPSIPLTIFFQLKICCSQESFRVSKRSFDLMFKQCLNIRSKKRFETLKLFWFNKHSNNQTILLLLLLVLSRDCSAAASSLVRASLSHSLKESLSGLHTLVELGRYRLPHF